MKRIKKEYYLIAVLLILFGILTLFVINNLTNNLDTFLFNSIIKIKNNPLSKVLYAITMIGSELGVLSVLILTLIIFFRIKKLSYIKYVIINVGLGAILMESIKHIVKRIRPSWKWIVQGGFSYPSGHTISALLLYGTLILLVYKFMKGKKRNLLIIFFALMILFISVSRIYFGAHYFTDVLASIILGTIILIISNKFINEEINNDKNKTR